MISFLFMLLVFNVNSQPDITYPIRFAYVNRIENWWPPQEIAKGIGVPSYASRSLYNMFALTVWTFQRGPLDIAKVWKDPVTYFSAQSSFGRTNTEIRRVIKQKYQSSSIKLLVSAFAQSEYPTTKGIKPLECAVKLAKFIQQTQLDGVDINYEDTKAFNDGVAQQWVIEFTKKLRQELPNHIISHTPQPPYFYEQNYRGGGYHQIHQQVGNLIDFYNFQFYNQLNEKYDTYESLFEKSLENPGILGSSIIQLNQRGVPFEKIVIGKPVGQQNVKNTGLVSGKLLGEFINQGYEEIGWFTGLMVWQYYSDTSGNFVLDAIGKIVSLTSNITMNRSTQDYQTQNTLSKNEKISVESQQLPMELIPEMISEIQDIDYPVRFTTIDKLDSWWPPEELAKSLGVPGYANEHMYNYISLSTWTCDKGSLNLAQVWENPIKYFSGDSVFGKTDQQIKTTLLEMYHKDNVSLLISAFGSSQNPITSNLDPYDCANKLTAYIIQNRLDGIEIKMFDTQGFSNGKAQIWLIKFIGQLRGKLPTHLIVITAMPSYFDHLKYKKGGLNSVNIAIGNSIDFYNILYFNGGPQNPYESYEEIFKAQKSQKKQTTVDQLINRGFPSYKIVIGKPVTKSDLMNTGWVSPDELSEMVQRAHKELGWFTGVILWEYISDIKGETIKNIISGLKQICDAPESCRISE